MHTRIKINNKLLKKIAVMPPMVGRKLAFWMEAVAHQGLYEVRKVPDFHDEPLKGKRIGQRSIRLNKAYRAIYIEEKGDPVIVDIIDVSKHKY